MRTVNLELQTDGETVYLIDKRTGNTFFLVELDEKSKEILKRLYLPREELKKR